MLQGMPPFVQQLSSATQLNPQPASLFNTDNSLPRPEYPRPNLSRAGDSWLNLNGSWEFAFDDDQRGRSEGWERRRHLPGQITVPFAYQSRLSGIGDPAFHDHLWYAREFELPPQWAGSDRRFLLRFGAVDYYCEVWVNGGLAGSHQGGHIPFSFDITGLLKRAEPNRIVVFVEDTQSKLQPRGKQYWMPVNQYCFYTRTSGIWQTVWLEAVPEVYLDRLQVQPDIDREELGLALEVAGGSPTAGSYSLKIAVAFEGRPVWSGEAALAYNNEQGCLALTTAIPLPQARWWSPESPDLYDLDLALIKDGQALDRVSSYFGMRKISREGGRVMLNNRPYYLRMVLDQGYFPDGWLTAPSDAALRQDIELIKAFGFNGARKHQKLEEPRWLYWADRLGLLVWDEMPSLYEYSPEAEQPFIIEWLEAMVRDYNHPCVMAWVPFNESWGVEQIAHDPRQQQFVQRVVELTRGLDHSRLVVDNDGWEHQAGSGDLLTIHDYTTDGARLLDRYTSFSQEAAARHLPQVSSRPVLLNEGHYAGEPVIFSEIGGMSLISGDQLEQSHAAGNWGYANAHDAQRLVEQYRGLIEAIHRLGCSSGFCYTQLTDVEQEVNGLLTFERVHKVDPAVIARINAGIDFQ